MNDETIGIIFMCAAMVLLGWFITLFWTSDNYDLDNTIGPIICEQDGREFVKVETTLGDGEPSTEDMIKIYCTEKTNVTTTAIYDNSVYEIRGG